MNLFTTDPDPYVCARNLDDKRIAKLCLEAVEMLCFALPTEVLRELNLEARVSREYHANHPVTLWVGRNQSNWSWTHQHGQALAKELHHRFNTVHSCAAELWFLDGKSDLLPSGSLEEFQNSARRKDLGIDCTHIHPTTLAYQTYLPLRWAKDARPPVWTNRAPPKFYFTEPA